MEKALSAAWEKQPLDFSHLVANLPVGICKILLDGKYTLLYGNPYFYDLLGYTPTQLQEELDQELIRVFLPEERDFVRQTLDEQAAASQSNFRIEHRLLCRNGQNLWVLVSGRFTTDHGAAAAHCVVVDITDRKQMEERLRIDEQRFRLALAQTESTIFDYDIETKIMIHADKSAQHYGLSYETHNVPDVLVETQLIHPDTAKDFLEMYRQIRHGAPTASCVMQARSADGTYAWCKITLTTIFDCEGKAVRAVGMLEDIDAQMRREERLRERSQRDALTQLYNKGVTEQYIRKLLARAPVGALFILDLDSFKNINDTYGHMFGDMVLRETARRITTLCRQEDIVGRIGGDEFLIYLDGISSEETAQHKAAEICAAFAQPLSQNNISAQVTCSIGIALYPTHGTSFETLCQKADIALYDAKKKGKNRCSLYRLEFGDTMGYFIYSNSKIEPQCPLFLDEEEGSL